MPIRTRKRLIAALVSVFFVQTWLVYSDPAGRATAPLSEQAAHGRRVWLRHNCQSCHQIHGFGGFLGPDLTNVSERLTKARLDAVLTQGAGQMPAFELEAAERGALAQFLAELNETGIGQLPAIRRVDPSGVLAEAIASIVRTEGALSDRQAAGRDVLLAQKCLACHLPNPATEHRGTNLTQVVTKLGRSGVAGILRTGVPSKGMPRFELPARDLEDLLEFLDWLAAHAPSVERSFVEATPKDDEHAGLPWFEYR